MNTESWTLLIVGITFAFYLYIGYLNRVRETAGFYVAGRGVPAIANGAATAADWMSGASFVSMAGLIAFLGYDGAVYLMGWTGGYVLLALLLAPYLRKYGKYTVPDFIGDRYYSNRARAVAAVATVFISLTYVAGQMRAVGIVFSRFLQVDIIMGVVIGMAIVAFFAILGGMKGITWTQVAQYGVLILAYLITAVAISARLTGNPIPQLALTFSDIAPRLNQIQIELGLKEYLAPFQNFSQLNVLFITLALMLGTAGLPHVIIRFYTVPSVADARKSAGWALLFIAILYTTAPALAVFAKYNILETLNGKTVQEARSIDWVVKWEETGLLKLEDKDGDGRLVMTSDNATSEIIFDRDIIVLSTPEVAELAPWVVGLVAAGGLAAALSTASGLLLAMSSAFSHDIYYRILRPDADERQRLLVGRATIFVAILIAGYFGVNPPGFVGEVVAFAFGLAAASLFPAIILGIFDKRMNREGAIAGILTGLVFTLVMIILIRSDRLLGTEAPILNSFLGVNAQGVGVYGAILNFIVSYVVSRMTPPPPEHIQHLVEDIRVPRGAGAAVAEH
ncbi:cation/acetate symporter [Ardenticatena maritima]|uniref:Cation/acetate symporter n=1 Tax=Ardenticatena maritima TaxID=872965 RepID=A0A0M8K8W0_9CHLR|nr:sodium:solute symporter family protein [Ardenticatena maritima]KPL89190.1 sodium:solute symporter [Ardenticatena maritima]GAP62869.1 cation/acetate symporter [Ardenticatena maritima]